MRQKTARAEYKALADSAKVGRLIPPPRKPLSPGGLGLIQATGIGSGRSGVYPLYRSAEAFEFAVNTYFDHVQELGRPPTMAGLALAIGFKSTASLKRYEEAGEDYATVVEVARTRVEEYKNELLLQGGQQTNGVIFDLKNNHGWSDRSTSQVTHAVDNTLAELLIQLQGTVLRPQLQLSADDAEDAQFEEMQAEDPESKVMLDGISDDDVQAMLGDAEALC